jgi:alpha-beta hydrolase superfamily lysophospholipase
MKTRTPLTITLLCATILLAALAGAIAFGGPKPIPPMASINDPFRTVDFSDLPPLARFTAGDGASLAYRKYSPSSGAPRGSVVLVHGSSASSNSMHPMAKAFAHAGYVAYALDIRGHGASGQKGQIAYVGQLEDDIAAFMNATSPPQPATLLGFSSGGGFVLRVAGSSRQDLFQSYLLLSPFLSQDAPTFRPDSGGWVSVGVPRYVGIALLNVAGIHAFNGLPVTSFALDDKAKSLLTPQYSYALATNFRPNRDYAADIKAVRHPCAVIAGAADELFLTDRFEPLFRSLGKDWPVTLLPGIGHIPLTIAPAALAQAVQAVGRLQGAGSSRS